MVASEPNIKSLSKNFRSYSVPAKKETVLEIPQEVIKLLKIKVTELKETFRTKEERAEKMISLLEQITWIHNPEPESLAIVQNVVIDAKMYIEHEIKFISAIKPLIVNGVVKKEYKTYIDLIDDMKEAVQDVESAFFSLPKDEAFYASLKELESL